MRDGRTHGSPPDPSARVDLHCHTSASFDGVADPAAMVRRAAERGLTHVAITDHDTISGALAARDAAPEGLTVIVGSEVLTTGGDLVVLFLEAPMPTGLAPRDAIAEARQRGALVGIPHPFDGTRRSLLLDPANAPLLGLVDWVEGWNARAPHRSANDRAMAEARASVLPAVAVSDAHALLEVGTAYTVVTGSPSTAQGLLAAIRGARRLVGPGADGGPQPGRWPGFPVRRGRR